MNIHKSQLFWGSLGARVLTNSHMNHAKNHPKFDGWIPKELMSRVRELETAQKNEAKNPFLLYPISYPQTETTKWGEQTLIW